MFPSQNINSLLLPAKLNHFKNHQKYFCSVKKGLDYWYELARPLNSGKRLVPRTHFTYFSYQVAKGEKKLSDRCLESLFLLPRRQSWFSFGLADLFRPEKVSSFRWTSSRSLSFPFFFLRMVKVLSNPGTRLNAPIWRARDTLGSSGWRTSPSLTSPHL